MERVAYRGFECVDVPKLRQRVRGGNDHRQQAGPFAVAVDEDLADQGSGHADGLQMCDRDDLTLCQLHDVVPPVDVYQPVGCDLGHHVASEVVAIGVEGGSGDVEWRVVDA